MRLAPTQTAAAAAARAAAVDGQAGEPAVPPAALISTSHIIDVVWWHVGQFVSDAVLVGRLGLCTTS